MSVKHVHDISAEEVAGATGTSRQVLIGPDEAPHFALRRFAIAPGGAMPRHTNSIEHEQYVLAGRALVGIADETFAVGAGHVVLIPAGVPHYYRCTGDEPFVFLCSVPNGPDEIVMLE